MNKNNRVIGSIVIAAAFVGVARIAVADDAWHGLTQWVEYSGNPILTAGAPGAWDEHIRERMWVTYDDGAYQAWYGGWKGTYDKTAPNLLHLGYATSTDGMNWTKNPTPVYTGRWTEDMCVVKSGGTYFMYAEDESFGDTTVHLLTSTNGMTWAEQGTVFERNSNVNTWDDDWVGTPVVWKESSQWYMLYEGGELGQIGIATSTNGIDWLRSSHNPVMDPGIGWEDNVLSPDSILKQADTYYMFYHAIGSTAQWQTGIAQSTDLVNWSRYSGNPVLNENSPVIVETPDQYHLYTWVGGAYKLYTSPKTAPEPSTYVLAVIAMLSMSGYAWRKQKRLPEQP